MFPVFNLAKKLIRLLAPGAWTPSWIVVLIILIILKPDARVFLNEHLHNDGGPTVAQIQVLPDRSMRTPRKRMFGAKAADKFIYQPAFPSWLRWTLELTIFHFSPTTYLP